ncbi:MAG: hypothetical protein CMLOHMNK_01271 [Steroidobacteraceae bacterium]|nr:hypothetical protein [Steroidobacteraceae bacterium]
MRLATIATFGVVVFVTLVVALGVVAGIGVDRETPRVQSGERLALPLNGPADRKANSAMPASATRTRPALRAPVTPGQWDADFRASGDLAAFVVGALGAAVEGDARAQYYVGQAVRACLGMTLMYGGDPDGAPTKLERALAEYKGPEGTLEVIRNAQRAEFNRCKGFFGRDVFDQLPARQGGYPHAYWSRLALENHDALAMATAAAEQLGGLDLSSGESPAAQLESAQRLLRSAVMSGDPLAIRRAGFAISMPQVGGDSLKATALILAGCQMGAECSSRDTAFSGHCFELGLCAEGETFDDGLKQSLGPGTYARIYALAAELRDAIEREDQATVDTFVSVGARRRTQ